MVNTGKPSSGCAECRRRRVKCDEARPECQRCRNVGTLCPGYTREFRFKTFDASRKKGLQSSASAESSGGTATAGPQARNGGTLLARKKCPRSIVPGGLGVRSIDVPVQDQSLDLFLSSFVYCMDLNAGESMFLDFLPDMYRDANQDSSISSTLAAVAHLNFMNRQKTGDLSAWVTSSYTKALARTNRSLSTRKTAQTDSTLASVYLLSVFELLMSKNDPNKPSEIHTWSEHNNGAMALLISRGPKQLKTGVGLQLFRLVHTTSLIGMMLERKAPPKELLLWMEEALQDSLQPNKEVLLISKRLHVLVEMMAFGQSPATTALQELGTFEDELALNATWRPRVVKSSDEFPDRWPNQYSFSSGFVMSEWLTHWTTTLLFHELALACCPVECPNNADSPQRLGLLAELDRNADQILRSVSFAFGELDSSGMRRCCISSGSSNYAGSAVGPTHLLWPLGAILASQYVCDVRKTFAREALLCSAHVFGVSRALHYV